MDHIFTAIQDKLSTEVPEIKWVDYDFGQLDHFTMRPPVLFPCALIDIEIPQASDRGGLSQNADVNITIRVAFEQPGQTNNRVPENIRDKALSIFRLLDKIHSALHGFEGENFNKILMRSINTERREDPLKVLNMRFISSYVISKRKELKPMMVTLEVTRLETD